MISSVVNCIPFVLGLIFAFCFIGRMMASSWRTLCGEASFRDCRQKLGYEGLQANFFGRGPTVQGA
jgi:hypothetical protein